LNSLIQEIAFFVDSLILPTDSRFFGYSKKIDFGQNIVALQPLENRYVREASNNKTAV
jgi:hypothetical protein